MTRKHTVLTVLIALTAIMGIPSAFAEIQNGNYGFTQMKNANLDFNTALDQFLLKIIEIVDQVNQNTADIQQVNGTIFDGPYSLESLIGNNMGDISDNTAAIEELQNNSNSGQPYYSDLSGVGIKLMSWNSPDTVNLVISGSISKVHDAVVDVKIVPISETTQWFGESANNVRIDDSFELPVGTSMDLELQAIDELDGTIIVLDTCIVNEGDTLDICDKSDVNVPADHRLWYKGTIIPIDNVPGTEYRMIKHEIRASLVVIGNIIVS